VLKAVPLSQQLVENAQADCDMTTAEGRARMLAQARPLWSALPEGALQRQLLGELAIKGNLPVDELERLWSAAPSRGRGRAAGAERAGEDEPPLPWDPGHDPSSYAPADPAGGHAGTGGGGRGRSGGWTPRGDGGGRFRGRFGARNREEAEREAMLRIPRAAPKTPEDRALQILFGHPEFWEKLTGGEHELLHGLPAPHGALVAWLERDQSEHGVRPWAVLRVAMQEDASLDDAGRRLADGDADPDATFVHFQSAVDQLMIRSLVAQRTHWASLAAADPQARQRWREADDHWREVTARFKSATAEE